jgi:hypothetical protein
MKLELSWLILEIYSNSKSHENLFGGSRVFYMWTDGRTDGQTEYRQMDRHDEANSRSSQFCERA